MRQVIIVPVFVLLLALVSMMHQKISAQQKSMGIPANANQEELLRQLDEIKKDAQHMEDKLAFLELLNNWKDFQLNWVQNCTCFRKPDVIYNTLDCEKEAQQIERDKVKIREDAERIFGKR